MAPGGAEGGPRLADLFVSLGSAPLRHWPGCANGLGRELALASPAAQSGGCQGRVLPDETIIVIIITVAA